MVTERNNFVNIREILARCTRHPMLKSLDLEQAIQYTIDFIGIVGMPTFYEDKLETIQIEDFRGLLPCDLVSIIQVKDLKTGICLRSMTDTFNPGLRKSPKNIKGRPVDIQAIRNVNPQPFGIDQNSIHHIKSEEMTFKTQGRVLFTSFRTGKVELSYKTLPVDKDSLPLLIDNANFLKALELYIKNKLLLYCLIWAN
jgi:hypothetical protein